VVNLFAFFDDAGTGNAINDPLVSCAGYLGRDGRWDAFSGKWRQLLRSYHVPPEKFSMKRYAHFKPPFDTWDENRRRSFMAQGLKLIQRYVQAGFVGVVRKTDYDTYLSESAKERTGGYFPYCAEMAIGLVEGYLALKAERQVWDEFNEYVTYVFEKGSLGAGYVHRAFEAYWGPNRHWLRTFGDPETKQSAELHAADILAYEVCKNFKDVLAGKTTLRHPFTTLVHGVPHFMLAPDGPEIAAMEQAILGLWERQRMLGLKT